MSGIANEHPEIAGKAGPDREINAYTTSNQKYNLLTIS